MKKLRRAQTFDVKQAKSASVKSKAAPAAPARELPESFDVREAKMAYFTDPFNVPRFKRRTY